VLDEVVSLKEMRTIIEALDNPLRNCGKDYNVIYLVG
jgi:hypothetical protein